VSAVEGPAQRKLRNILIVGCPGGGKSTLAEQLSQITGLRVIYMDHIYWKPGWVLRSQEEITALITKEIERDGWICEGNNAQTFSLRVPKAQMLIWLDLPRRTCLWRIIKRTLKYYGKTRESSPQGCPERFDWDFFKLIWNYNKASGPRLKKLFQETEGQLERVHLKSANEVSLFIDAMKKNC
jgi:adenylate kinase family enzyme